jgi:hypothetical protein
VTPLAERPGRPTLPWWAWILAVDAVLLSVIGLGSYWPRNPGAEAVLSWLAIHHEMNLAVWFSGAQLLLAALLMYERASIGSGDERGAWAILAGISASLSLDEIGSIHERLGDASWRPLLVLAVPLGVALGWALLRLARKPGRRRELGLILGAYGLFAVVAGLEYLESVVRWAPLRNGGIGLEESLELAAFLLLLFAAAGHRRVAWGGLRTVIPDPERLHLLRGVLGLALLLHAAIALLVAPYLSDLYGRGNPIVWYPFAVYGLLACQALTAREGAAPPDRRAWGWLAGFLLLGSIAAVFPLTKLVPHIDRVLPRWTWEGAFATHIFIVLPALLLVPRALGGLRGSLPGVLTLLAVLVLVRVPGPVWWLDALTPGLVAYLWTLPLLGLARRAEPVALLRPEPSLPA